jgi:GalNAc-alpha-(1->4)-GalNAc-alpha-(1->3)-diNAcBac-PP-undecaprenol alpha-1,4-N-acetyl-D-galactosaminyltransferase
LVIADLGPGGAQRVISTLANAWAARGRKLSVATFSEPADDFFVLVPEINRIVIGGLAPSEGIFHAIGSNLGRIWRLRRTLRRSGANSALAFLGATNILTIMAATGLGIRVVISERNDPSRQSLGRGWNALRHWIYRHANVVTANSRGAVDALEDFVPREKLAFIANPTIDFGDASPGRRDQRELGEPRILHIGRLAHQKGQDILLRAFALVAPHAPHWRLAILGEGDDAEMLGRLAGELEVTDRIDWLGRVNDPKPHYLDAAIFALPSRFEGTPNVLLEAMAAGLPAVVTDASPGPLEYVEDGKTGIVVPADDVTALAEALLHLIRDDGLRERMGQAGRERIGRNNLEAVLKDWEQVLQLPPSETPT